MGEQPTLPTPLRSVNRRRQYFVSRTLLPTKRAPLTYGPRSSMIVRNALYGLFLSTLPERARACARFPSGPYPPPAPQTLLPFSCRLLIRSLPSPSTRRLLNRAKPRLRYTCIYIYTERARARNLYCAR